MTDHRTPPTPKRAIPRQGTSRTAFTGDVPPDDDPLLGFTPVPHTAPRSNSITADKQRAFIAELAACGIVTQAARKIGKSVEALYKLRNRPGAEGFRTAWEEAIDRGVARLEDTALARALEGEERPLVSRGEIIGHYTRQNNGLLMFLLRQRRSERYSAGMVHGGNLKPGNPTYERIRKEIMDELYGDPEEIRQSLNAKLEQMKQRMEAAKRMEEEDWGEE